MIVDSSALSEQVVTDAVESAFRSAGQRCSALRVLFLQDEVAPKILEMLAGAMDELRSATRRSSPPTSGRSSTSGRARGCSPTSRRCAGSAGSCISAGSTSATSTAASSRPRWSRSTASAG
jgi:hypothetical protein